MSVTPPSTPRTTPPPASISLPTSALPTPKRRLEQTDSDITGFALETLLGMEDPAHSQWSDSTHLIPNSNPSRNFVVLDCDTPNPQHPQPNVSPAYRNTTPFNGERRSTTPAEAPTPNTTTDCKSAKQGRGFPRIGAICLAAERCLGRSFLLPAPMQVSAPKEE